MKKNKQDLDLSHFGGIILFNSLNIFKPPFLGYRLEAWWKKERHQKHEWESTNKARIMFDDVAQYLHLSLLQLWCETRQGVRAWTIPSLAKSFFLQRVSDRIWQLIEILKWYVCMLELTLLLWLLFLVFLVATVALVATILAVPVFSPRSPDEQRPGHRATYGVLVTAPATVVAPSCRPSRRPVHPKESRHLHLERHMRKNTAMFRR